MNFLTTLFPEIIIAVSIIFNIIFSLTIKNDTYKKAKLFNVIIYTITTLSIFFAPFNSFENLISNSYTFIFKIMILLSSILITLGTPQFIREKRKKSFEFFSIINTLILGGMFLISSNDFLIAFIALETLSISCYLLTGARKNHKSKEASLKYLITGASASCILLLGISYLFGLTGSINITQIGETIINDQFTGLFIVSSILIICGLMFKLGCIPFSNWIVDIYEGSSFPVCAILSLIPKIATIGFISRLYVEIFQYSPLAIFISILLALISILYASIGAIKQTNIKRLFAYSSIIHSGFILIATTIATNYSISTVIFYLFTYLFMNAGMWIASTIFHNTYNSENINDYKGLFYRHPYFSSALIICLIGLAGLPPTSGFLAKIYLFTSIAKESVILLILAITLTIIALLIYLKFIKILFEKENINLNFNNKFNYQKFILYLCAIITFLLCIYPNTIINFSQLFSIYI